MIPFDYQPRTRIVFGAGQIEVLGNLASEMGARRALLVSDPGIVAAGHVQKAIASLEAAGIETHLYDGVVENPTTQHVEAGVLLARRHSPEILIGVGGGSSMDCTKGINFVYTGGGRMQDYRGVGKATREMLPMIAVPTTAGTGSETQSFALISDAETHQKMACGDKKASFRAAILDPALTVTQPVRITALTGIDAIAHAVETYVTRRRNPVSIAFSREAWLLLEENFVRVLREPTNLTARGGMQLGACFAGLAIENSMLGATHSLANPLTAHYGVPHGQAIAIMLPHVIRYNGRECDQWYRELLETIWELNGAPPPERGAEGLAELIAELVGQAGLASRLQECGVEQAQLGKLAAAAATEWTAGFNPRTVTEADLLGIYRAAY